MPKYQVRILDGFTLAVRHEGILESEDEYEDKRNTVKVWRGGDKMPSDRYEVDIKRVSDDTPITEDPHEELVRLMQLKRIRAENRRRTQALIDLTRAGNGKISKS